MMFSAVIPFDAPQMLTIMVIIMIFYRAVNDATVDAISAAQSMQQGVLIMLGTPSSELIPPRRNPIANRI